MGFGTPTFSINPATYLGIEKTVPATYTIAGIPYDLGTSNRPGARFGPEGIRHASRMLVDGGHPSFGHDPKSLDLGDIGNFQIVQGDMMATMVEIAVQAESIPHLITLGGDHSITLPLLQAAHHRHGPVGLLHFDAHLDTWSDNFGGINFGHGNPFFHAIEQGLIDTTHMIQIGIRSPVDRKTMEWTNNQGSRILTAFDVHQQTVFQTIAIIEEILGDHPTYLTIDIDVLDPAFAPGTGTPEIGGLASWQLQMILRYLIPKINLIGMDIVEVSPPYDHAEITALAAATMVWEYICRHAFSS